MIRLFYRLLSGEPRKTAIVDRAHFSFGPKVRLYVVFEGCVVDVVPYSHCEHACPVHVQARFSRSDCYMYVHVDLHVFVGIHLNNRARL